MTDFSPIVGNYVVYKDTVHVVVKVMLNGRVQLLNPIEGNAKVTVLLSNVIPTNHRPMLMVQYMRQHYLVSRIGTIISLKTRRIMEWPEDHGHRTSIMDMFNEAL